MTLQQAFEILLERYETEIKKPFSGNEIASFVRNEIPHLVESLIEENNKYIFRGSSGKGNWARVPWIAIFDKFVTETAQNGFYVVYLVKADFSGMYLSLNQGVTSIINKYGNANAKRVLSIKAHDYLVFIENRNDSFIYGNIDLNIKDKSDLGAFYEEGSICAKYYARNAIPDDNSLKSDLQNFLDYYSLLSTKEVIPMTTNFVEEDEVGLGHEDLTKLREHKRIERNQNLSEKVKKLQGYTCKACGFNFSKNYIGIGNNFIEAHHLVPLHTLKGQKILLDPKKDFAVLCSNCHRMIHKSDCIDDIDNFRENYLNK